VKDIESLPKLYIRGAIVPRETSGEFGESFSAADVIDFLEDHKADPEFVVDIKSNGGSVSEAKEIFRRLKNSGKKITTITYVARSAATLLMLVGKTRLIVEKPDVRIHQARVYADELGNDALLAEDLMKISMEIARATEDILNIYCEELGEEKRTSLMAYMAEDMDLAPKEVIKLGFATGFYKKDKKEVTADQGFTITDHLQSIIQNNMSKEKESESKLEAMFKNFSGLMARKVGRIVNEVILKLTNGKQINVVPADPDAPEILIGATITEVDEAGVDTGVPVPDGEYPVDGGKVLVVVGGVVTEEREAVDVAKLQTELAEKDAALVAAQKEIADVKAAMEEYKVQMKAKVDLIQASFDEFKTKVPGDKKEDKNEPDPTKIDMSKMTTAQRVRAMSKERAKLGNIQF
jgi:ATP-dependent protease ClpP protease subunit